MIFGHDLQAFLFFVSIAVAFLFLLLSVVVPVVLLCYYYYSNFQYICYYSLLLWYYFLRLFDIPFLNLCGAWGSLSYRFVFDTNFLPINNFTSEFFL